MHRPILAIILLAGIAGCGSTERLSTPPPLLEPAVPIAEPACEQPVLSHAEWVAPVEAYCPVPTGWKPDPLKTGDKRDHQVWISPSGATAYGVLCVRNVLLPLASDDRVLDEFLKNMKKSDGRADLLLKEEDKSLAGIGGLRFVAEGGVYKVRANLIKSGTRTWFVYAGTRTADPVNEQELTHAALARDRTQVAAARSAMVE